MNNTSAKTRVGILGTGNIGTDLLMKAMRSDYLTCSIFTGRNFNSAGMKRASDLGVRISDRGVEAILEDPSSCDIIFDATSAHSHVEHWKKLEPLGKTVVDMTPAKIGRFCIPAINAEECLASNSRNINMVTCGGQSSIPIAKAISDAVEGLDYIEIASSISSRSAGPATRLNLDEYVETTELALKKFSLADKTKAILILNPAHPPIDMQTTIYAKASKYDLASVRQSVLSMVVRITQYVPGYELVVPPTIEGGRLVTTIKVRGNGDYLPQYAGNLDIINCAAIAIAEAMAKRDQLTTARVV